MSTLAKSLYPSLLLLPSTYVDTYGNFKLKDVDENSKGLRPRVDYVMALKPQRLRGTKLNELLNWLRWGAQTGVMWECTLAELISIIEKWEMNNLTQELYGVAGNPTSNQWQKLWERGSPYAVVRKYQCPNCNISVDGWSYQCKNCGAERGIDWIRVFDGPRGVGTYNLVLRGADGCAVAEAAWATRGKNRPIPPCFQIH